MPRASRQSLQRFQLPPRSLETHLPISLPVSGSCLPLSFFSIKSGLPHWGARRASQIHLTCHFCQPLFFGPLPPISHHALLSLPSFPSVYSSRWVPAQAASSQLRMETFPGSHDSSFSSVPEWLKVTGELKRSKCQSYAQLLLAVTVQYPWIQLCAFLWSFPTVIASVLP